MVIFAPRYFDYLPATTRHDARSRYASFRRALRASVRLSDKFTIVCGGPAAAAPKVAAFQTWRADCLASDVLANSAHNRSDRDLAMRFQRRAAHGPRTHVLSLTVTAVGIAITACLGGMRTPIVQAAATYQAQITSELVFSGVGFTVLVDPSVSLPDPFVSPRDRAGTFPSAALPSRPGRRYSMQLRKLTARRRMVAGLPCSQPRVLAAGCGW